MINSNYAAAAINDDDNDDDDGDDTTATTTTTTTTNKHHKNSKINVERERLIDWLIDWTLITQGQRFRHESLSGNLSLKQLQTFKHIYV